MKNKRVLYLIVLSFILGGAGCTSKKVDQDNSEVSELTGETDSSLSGEIGEVATDDAAGSSDDFAGDAAESKDDFGEMDSSDVATSNDGATDDLDGLDAAPDETPDVAAEGDASSPEADNNLALDETANSDQNDLGAAVPEQPDAGSSLNDDTATENFSSGTDESQGLSEPEAAPVAKAVIPLQKMVSSPYTSHGMTVNALYVAREGDTLSSVSSKIYGEDRTKDLKKINSTFSRRDLKVGDKVYYSSPQRPDDSSTMLTYYEDVGLAPEVYLSQPGDNIRVISQNLLGHKDSWKEIWATNLDVESKGDLTEGTRLRYWPTSSSAPTLAKNDSVKPPAASGSVDDTPPPMSDEPPPMPEEVAAAPVENTQVNEPVAEPAPVPPPPPVAAIPPPPPPRPAEKAPANGIVPGFGDDPDQLMALGAGAILLLAMIFMFVIIKKKRARRNSNIDFQTATHTQIE